LYVIKESRLSNGLRVIVKENHFSPAVAIQCWVGVGSIHEKPMQRGMAHFIEHMLFKGTESRSVGEIAATVEGCGGEINAYTTFDHTVFHLTLGAPYANLGIELLGDALFRSSFEVSEFEKERDVILEEIKRGLDNPGTRVGYKVFDISYRETEVGRPIIGDESTVGQFNRDDVFAFYNKWYQANNMTFVIVGDVDCHQVHDKIDQLYASINAGPLSEHKIPERASQKFEISVLKGDYQQPRVEIVFKAPRLEDEDTPLLDLAAFALGSGELSRFTRNLRDTRQVLTAASASVYTPPFGGIFDISGMMEADKIGEAISGLAEEVALLIHHMPVTEEELKRARANLRAERLYRDETVDGQARSLGFGLRTSHGCYYEEIFESQMNAATHIDITKALKKWIDPYQPIIVVMVPEGFDLAEDAIRESYLNGLKQGKAGPKTPSKLKKTAEQPAEIIKIKDGLTLIYRRNQNGQLFSMTAASEGGMRAEDDETVGIYNAIASLIGCATESMSYEKLMNKVEGLGATLAGFSGKDSFGMQVQCLNEHFIQLIDLFAPSFLEPVFPEEQWNSLVREIQMAIKSQNDSSAGICLRHFQEHIFDKHPYKYPIYGTEESITRFTPKGVEQFFKDQRDAGPWVIAATGPFLVDEVAIALENALTEFNPSQKKRRFISSDLVCKAGAHDDKVTKQREQSHIVIGFPGLSWDDPERHALDVLTNILGGHGGRLFVNLRDKQSLAYTVTPVISYGCHPGALGVYIACAPDKSEKAIAEIKREFQQAIESLPKDEEVERTKNYIIGNHDMGLQRSESQTSTMALMEVYGIGFDDFVKYPTLISEVTGKSVRQVARRVLDAENRVEVLVGP
jgi:zinc protease